MGYKIIAKPLDWDSFGSRKGLEGPFLACNGMVVYYDPKEGKYYNPRTDMYIPNDEAEKLFP